MSFGKSLITNENTDNLYLCFSIDNTTYSINAKNVLEITTLPFLNMPQKLPDYIVGILNYNDLFINVIDIRKVFDLPEKKYELTNKVVIIKGDESLIAIIVDEVTDFYSAKLSQIHRVMGENYNNITKSFYKLEENVVNIIDIHSLEKIIKKVNVKENTTNYTNLFPSDEDSICILQKRRNEIAAIPKMNLDTVVYGKDQYIIFKLLNHTYCIYSLFVKELINLKNYTLTAIPCTPPFVLGIVNLKGSFYTVIDLKRFIGLKDTDNSNTEKQEKIEHKTTSKAIVIESNELKLAFLVDEIANIINISKDNIAIKNDMTLDNLFIRAEAYLDNKVYNILNIDKLINDERLYIDNSK